MIRIYTHTHTCILTLSPSPHTHTDVQYSLDLTNNGVVHALFSHQASDSDELGFQCEGEVLHVVERKGRADQWWWAKNSSGEKGYIPCTHLGTNERHTVIL